MTNDQHGPTAPGHKRHRHAHRQGRLPVPRAVRRPANPVGIIRSSWLVGLAITWTTGGMAAGFQYTNTFTTKPSDTEFKTDVSHIEMDLSSRTTVVSGTINGKGPFKMLVDTTATRFTIDDDIVEQLGLNPVDIPRIDDLPRPKLHGTAVRVETMGLGQVVFHGFNALSTDLDSQAGGFRRFDAVIPFAMFSECLLTLDYPKRTLILKRGELPEPDGQDVLPYNEVRGCPALTLGSSPFPGDIFFNSASKKALTLLSMFSRSKNDTLHPNKKRKGRRHVSDFDTDTPLTVRPIHLGRHELVGLPIAYDKADSSFGYELLKRFALTFDQKNKRVRLVRAGNDPISLFPHSRFGLVFLRHMTDLNVAYIIPGSPASRSPLKAGDRIKEFETKPSQSCSDDYVRKILRESDTVLVKIERYGIDMMVVLDVRD